MKTLKFCFVESGFCRVIYSYERPDIKTKVYCCLQWEIGDLVEVYFLGKDPDNEPDSPITVKPDLFIESPPFEGSNDFEKAILTYIDAHNKLREAV